MILDKDQQLVFLAECYQHIIRINNSYLSNSEKKDTQTKLELSDDQLAEQLPKSIIFQGHFNSAKNNKLSLLVDIYNKVSAKNSDNVDNLDLNQIYDEAKEDYSNKRLVSQCYFNVEPDILMGLHRRDFLRDNFLGRWFASWFAPKSATFLSKYDFFKTSNPEIEDSSKNTTNFEVGLY